MLQAWCSTGGARELQPRILTNFLGQFFAAFILLIVATVPGNAEDGASDQSWRVGDVKGQVHVRDIDGDVRPLKAGDRLGASAEIISGENGSAVLVRGESTINIARDTRVELPMLGTRKQASIRTVALGRGQESGRVSGAENVFQSFGTMLYRVKPRQGRRFKVHTPYLVATIKGTIFSVSVNADGAAVHVSEGLVEVTPTLGGESAMVPAGQTAIAHAKRHAGLEIHGRDSNRASGSQSARSNKHEQGRRNRSHDTVVFRDGEQDHGSETGKQSDDLQLPEGEQIAQNQESIDLGLNEGGVGGVTSGSIGSISTTDTVGAVTTGTVSQVGSVTSGINEVVSGGLSGVKQGLGL